MLTAVDVRKRRILGAVSVAFGILLIVLAIMAMTGSLGATTKKAASGGDGAGQTTAAGESSADQGASGSEGSGGSSGSESESSSSDAPAAEKLPLTVLNAGGVGGLAAAGQAAFEAQQWPVAEIGNYTDEPPAQSTVYYPADDDDAKAAAELLVSEFPDLTAEQAPDGFAYSGLVVVLAGEWQPGG